MFGLGFWEIAVILVLALLILGPKKLPELARTLGKGIRELKGATEGFTQSIDTEARRPPVQPIVAPVETAEILPPDSEKPVASKPTKPESAEPVVEARKTSADPDEPAPSSEAPSEKPATDEA